MNPCELSASITALANILANQLSDQELNIAAVIFSQLGDTLDTISVQRSFCCSKEKTIFHTISDK